MDLQEKAKNVLITTFIDTLNCRQEEAEILTEEVVTNLKKNDFYIQWDWESAEGKHE